MMDFYLRVWPDTNESRRWRLARLTTVAWALVLFGLAVLALHRAGRVVEVGLQIASITYGALLGVFLLGVLTKRATQGGAIAGMIAGLAVELYLWRWSQYCLHMVGRHRHVCDIRNRIFASLVWRQNES